MVQFLDQAEELLQAIVRCHDTSAITLLHHLRDLAEILDNLKLYDECRLTGNCALDLAEALVRRSLEFRNEQAETFALIAGLTVYQPRARTLFTQAVSLCEEIIDTNALDTNKLSLLVVFRRASKVLHGDSICYHWLENAVRIMIDLPLSIVSNEFRSVIYYNFGLCLQALAQYARAAEAQHKAVSICRELASENPMKYPSYLARALASLGLSLHALGKHDDAAAASKEALEHCRTASVQGTLQYGAQLADTLYNYGIALNHINQTSKALEVEREAVSLYYELAQTETECTKWHCYALHVYGWCCHLLGRHTEAVAAYQESISLLHAQPETNPEEETYLVVALHNMASSFHALGQETQAHAAATEALHMNQQRVLKSCRRSPNFNTCFVCQRADAPKHQKSDKSSQHRKRDKAIGFFRWNRAR